MKRGDVYYAELGPGLESEHFGLSPVLIIQNNKGNRCSQTTIVAILQKQSIGRGSENYICFKTDKMIENKEVLIEHIRTIDTRRLKRYIGTAGKEVMQHVDKALLFSCGIIEKGRGVL